MSDDLRELGWDDDWQERFAPHAAAGLAPARVVRGDRGSALVATPAGIVRAQPAVRLRKAVDNTSQLPAVGDWVAVTTDPELEVPLIEAVLPRTSAIEREDPGEGADVQVLAANIDVVFVVHPIAEAPNLRRIERELSLAWDSGAVPVVVLTKADLSADPEAAQAAVAAIALGVDILAMNARSEDGARPLLDYTAGQRTAVLFGPSGAGKSTLVNALLGRSRQATGEVREGDGRGRHTTVARELIPIPGGGVLIDTPGLRALGLTGSDEGIAATFSDVLELAAGCRFRDCTHREEPGCAVRAAVEEGTLPPARLESYRGLILEAEDAAARAGVRLKAEAERRGRLDRKAARGAAKRDRNG
jgi:ribosome biogenesis GTPase